MPTRRSLSSCEHDIVPFPRRGYPPDQHDGASAARQKGTDLHSCSPRRLWRGALRDEIGIAHGIQPEERGEHPGRQELPGHNSGYATQEEHHALDYLPVVELSKATHEG